MIDTLEDMEVRILRCGGLSSDSRLHYEPHDKKKAQAAQELLNAATLQHVWHTDSLKPGLHIQVITFTYLGSAILWPNNRIPRRQSGWNIIGFILLSYSSLTILL